jgi:hypothetical protein
MESSSEGSQAAHEVGMTGVFSVVTVYVAGCLLAYAVIAISGVMTVWLAALVVGAALLAYSAVLRGKRRLS